MNSAGEVLGPTAISLSWQPPAQEGQNGIITSYTILITEVLTDTNTTYQRDGSRNELVITGLHPYYDYSCAVAAQTSVGMGPFSAPFTVTTHQDGESMIDADNPIQKSPGIIPIIQCTLWEQMTNNPG